MLTLIIGLEDAYRGTPLEEQLTSLGVSHERSAGVVGEYLGAPVDEYVDDDAVNALYGRPLRPGEIGCALAHRICYQRLIDSDAEWALVFEDDARVVGPEALSQIVRRFSRLVPFDEPAVFMLYGRQVTTDPRLHGRLDDSATYELIRTPMTATGYLINRRAAQHILDTGLPLRNPADWPISVEGYVRFAATYPWPVIPDETDEASSIGHRGGGRNSLMRLFNRVGSAVYLKWLVQRRHYRSLKEYHDWEVRRRFVQLALGRRQPYRLPENAPAIPSANRFAVIMDHVLGGRRDRRFLTSIES
ncbi:glycosyltransferase family 25 protein [Microbacterium profundi]